MTNNFKYIAWAWAALMSVGCIDLIGSGEFDVYTLLNLAYSWAVVWYVSQEKK